jgi:hypothetical protein
MAKVNLVNRVSDEVSIVNKTNRNRGAVGHNAITPQYVASVAHKGDTILDYGAGKAASHALNLRAQGLDVTACDIGENLRPGVHDPSALKHKYDIVYASNVLNVAPSVDFLRKTLSEVQGAVKTEGRAIFNYPQEPRKAGLTTKQVEDIVREYFPDLRRVGSTGSAPLWEAGSAVVLDQDISNVLDKRVTPKKQPPRKRISRIQASESLLATSAALSNLTDRQLIQETKKRETALFPTTTKRNFTLFNEATGELSRRHLRY